MRENFLDVIRDISPNDPESNRKWDAWVSANPDEARRLTTFDNLPEGSEGAYMALRKARDIKRAVVNG